MERGRKGGEAMRNYCLARSHFPFRQRCREEESGDKQIGRLKDRKNGENLEGDTVEYCLGQTSILPVDDRFAN